MKPLHECRVLIVDDHHDGLATLAMLLELMGAEVHSAASGPEGLRKAEQVRPDVVLLDLAMPGMDGYEVCQKIREQPWGREMILVALSGYGQEDDKRRSRESGFDHHLVKPVGASALQDLLSANCAA
jgi:two-component system CheB/CheR fusion protein